MLTALDTTQVKLLSQIAQFASRSALTSEQEQQLGNLLLRFLNNLGGQWGLYRWDESDYRWCSWFPSQTGFPQTLPHSTLADSTFELEDENRQYGMLICKNQTFSEETEIWLVLLKNMLTIIMRMQGMQVSPTPVTDTFFDLLLTNTSSLELPGLTSYLGFRSPYIVVRIEILLKQEEPLSSIIREILPTLLYTSSGEKRFLTCLIHAGRETNPPFMKWLEELFFELQGRLKTRIFLGASNICQELTFFSRAYMQAEIAMLVARINNPHIGGIERHEDIGIYQTFSAFPPGTNFQQYPFETEITQIAHYDEEKKTEYLRTLESYLQLGGNTLATAKLFGKKHSQTIDDRLALIAERFLSGRVNVKKDTDLWPLLRLAIASYRLQQLDRVNLRDS